MLTKEMTNDLNETLKEMTHPITIECSLNDNEFSQEMRAFLQEVVECTDKLILTKATSEYTPSFSLLGEEGESGIRFAGIPLGEEFETFIQALILVGGGQSKITEADRKIIQAIDEDIHFVTYINLTCNKCPEVVQVLHSLAVLNPRITSTMVDTSFFQVEVEKRNIFALPTIYMNDREFSVGRMTLEDILYKLLGKRTTNFEDTSNIFDILILGAGAAGVSAAVYSARKGLNTGIVYNHFGGQVNDIAGLENFIGFSHIDGPELIKRFKKQLDTYAIDHFSNTKVNEMIHGYDLVTVKLENGQIIKAKTIIVATGAHRRLMDIPGELEFKNRGISYCAHCDGALYKNKNVVVVGGGNTGTQSAPVLADVAKKVTILEWKNFLTSDQILIDRVEERDNIEVAYNAFLATIKGEQSVGEISYMDHNRGQLVRLDTDGVFIMTGFTPNTHWAEGVIDMNEMGEIQVDKYGKTNHANIFAVGDCTNREYDQIVISIGEGANAVLAAHDFILRMER